MYKQAILTLSVCLLTACASTPTSKTSSNGNKEFVAQKNGAKFQSVTGLYCPGAALGNLLTKTNKYNDSATDVSCTYDSKGGLTTIYLSAFPNLTLSDYFQSSVNAIGQGSFKDAVTYDEDLSNSCMAQSQIMSGLAQIFTGSEKEDNTITIDLSGESGEMPYKVAVFGGQDISSYLAVSPVDDKYMKIRHTMETSSKDCDAVHGLMRDLVVSVGKPEGAKAKSSLESFLSETGKKSE